MVKSKGKMCYNFLYQSNELFINSETIIMCICVYYSIQSTHANLHVLSHGVIHIASYSI